MSDVTQYLSYTTNTNSAIERAVNNLEQPDKNTADAVDVRQQLDLRIGYSFYNLINTLDNL